MFHEGVGAQEGDGVVRDLSRESRGEYAVVAGKHGGDECWCEEGSNQLLNEALVVRGASHLGDAGEQREGWDDKGGGCRFRRAHALNLERHRRSKDWNKVGDLASEGGLDDLKRINDRRPCWREVWEVDWVDNVVGNMLKLRRAAKGEFGLRHGSCWVLGVGRQGRAQIGDRTNDHVALVEGGKTRNRGA